MELNFIDTHSHQYAEDFKDDLKEVTQRTIKSGVNKVLMPNIDSGSFELMNKLSKEYPDLYIPMLGLHPCSVKPETYRYELDFVLSEIQKKNFIAIGEIGMDLYWDKTTQGIQEEALRIQCQLAVDTQLPIALHTRNATKEVLEIINDFSSTNLTGVFHCFGDGIEEANRIIDLGYKIGIGGVVTFKNSGLDKVIKDVSMENILLETDSPYLAPAPYRGKRNESSYLPLIAQKIADVKQISLEEVAKITTQNARELFSI